MIPDTYSLLLDLVDEEGIEHRNCLVHYTVGLPATRDEPAEPDEVEVVRPLNVTFRTDDVLAAVYSHLDGR